MEIADLKNFFRFSPGKAILAFILLLFTGIIGFFTFFIGIPILYNTKMLAILALPIYLTLGLTKYLGTNITIPILIFWIILEVLYIYFLSCIIILLKNYIRSIEWTTKKISVIVIVIAILICVYAFFNFGGGDLFIATAEDSGATANGVAEVVMANNKFAIDLYSQIKSDENLFFSPWSISNAMVMVYEGAKGETADQIQSVFYYPDDSFVLRSSYASVLNNINKGGGKYELKTANAIWLQKDYPFLAEYKDVISRYYLGKINSLDFVNNPSDASNKINSWVAGNTNNKITKIVDASMFDELTRAVLTNAIYFKGKWVHQFDKDDTKDGEFTLNSGQKIQTKMMKLMDKDLKFNYVEADNVQILEIGYQGNKISMLVLLPRSDITYLESIISAEKIQEWRNQMSEKIVFITMPKYKFETTYLLGDKLKEMGMPLPFTWPGADFSGMDGTQMLYIDKVIHKAYIDVYEEGTEAAAATVIVMSLGTAIGPQYIEFKADHPFIFILQEKSTGNILFMGKVMDPR